MIDATKRERPRDVSICAGVGERDGEKLRLYPNGGNSSFIQSDCVNESVYDVEIVTLKSICDDYVDANQTIHFLKIDVEGFEKKVLLGADFKRYRPIVIVMESTLPDSTIPCFDEWEYILIDAEYHLAFSWGVNRYYVANEHMDYDNRFLEVPTLEKEYYIIDGVLMPMV